MAKSNDGQAESAREASSVSSRRNFLRAAGGSAIVSTLAGCIRSSGSGDGSGDGNSSGTGISGNLKLGLLAPLRNQALGRSYEQAAKVLQKQVNNRGGLLGAKVEFAIRDSKYDASTARKGYRKLILQDNVDVSFEIIGSDSMQVITWPSKFAESKYQ